MTRDLIEAGVVRAGTLAAEGRYAEAEALLAGLPAEAGVAPLKLLAKIRAQQGRLADAIEAWKRVLGSEPGDADATAALALAERLHAHGGSARRPIGSAVALAVAVTVGVGAFGWWLGRGSVADRIDRLGREVGQVRDELALRPVATDAIAAMEQRLEALAGAAARIEEASAALATRQHGDAAELRAALAALGRDVAATSERLCTTEELHAAVAALVERSEAAARELRELSESRAADQGAAITGLVSALAAANEALVTQRQSLAALEAGRVSADRDLASRFDRAVEQMRTDSRTALHEVEGAFRSWLDAAGLTRIRVDRHGITLLDSGAPPPFGDSPGAATGDR